MVCAKPESLASIVPVFVLQKKLFPATSYFGNITMAKICINRDMINPFTVERDASMAKNGEVCGETSAGG